MSAQNTFHTAPEQTYFEFYKNLKEGLSPRIQVDESNKTTFRDGGSSGYPVINQDECGFYRVIQDFSIRTKTRGAWYANKPPPNHIDWHPIDFRDIDFV
jgi:hypothetical protein